MTDWDGDPALWTVKEGMLVGKTNTPEDMKYHQYLVWRGGILKNFDLRAKVQVIGDGNSGIQYRSSEEPEIGPWSIKGYQCDIHPHLPYNGMFYHTHVRGVVSQNGESIVVDPSGKKWIVAEREPVSVNIEEWHDYRVLAQGNVMRHEIDGKLASELRDYDETKRALEGLLAFQIHKGPPMTVRIKDVRLKVLPDGGVVPFSEADLPSDAQEVPPPGKAAPPKQANGGQAAKAAPKAAPGKAGAGKGNAGKNGAAEKAGQGNAGKGKAPNQPAAQVGPAIGENIATPTSRIKVPDGFQVELLYSVPGVEEGSWVALCVDDEGRIYASDQYGGLYRFTPPPLGKTLTPADVEKVPADIRAVNGMHFADGALYVGVNDNEQKISSGFYKVIDSDGDDKLDKVVVLRELNSRNDHGVHAVVPIPGSEDFYLVCGNNVGLTEVTSDSPVPPVWGEDHLLPRLPDGRGFNRYVLAPGGSIYRVSRDGKRFSRFASGFRNLYDASFNREGELFTYDADMEYDFNTPWYRPTRINHVVSGGEYGWRNGAGKYPEFYADNLPGSVNIGPGSPTCTLFGYGAKFPERYQNAFFILDWSWGKIHAVHLNPDGASYTGEKEDFLYGAPLPVTDAIIHPQDGAMYFAIGGRRVQSGLYRVSYIGEEDTTEVTTVPSLTAEAKLRHKLEAYHGAPNPAALGEAWPYLDHADRHIRWAARTILEHQPVDTWRDKALAEKTPTKQVTALLALARAGGVCPYHRIPAKLIGVRPGDMEIKQAPVPKDAIPTPPVDLELRTRILDALLALDFASLDEVSQETVLRTVEIVLNRFDGATEEQRQALIAHFDPVFPAATFAKNWLLCEILAYLQSPNVAAKGMALIQRAASQEEQLEYARSLRYVTAGWTRELRTSYLNWFLKAVNYRAHL